MSDLPGQVADAHRRLAALARRPPVAAGPTSPEPDPDTPRPDVALVGGPGRGRRALAAALLGRDTLPAGVRRLTHPGVGPFDDPDRPRATGSRAGPERPDGAGTLAVAVPLLEELDLVLPPRGRTGPGLPTDGATAVLVLVDGGAPLDRAELDAIAGVATGTQTVLFALGGTEAHRGWRTVLDADRALVADRVPRLAAAQWFPVSAALARRAELDGVPADVAADRRRAGGLADLQRALHLRLARRGRALHELNRLRTLAGGLAAEAGPPPTAPQAVVSRRECHVRWRTELATTRIAVGDDLGARFRALAAATRRRIETADRAGLAAVPDEVAGEVEALGRAVVAALGDRLRRLVLDTLDGLLTGAELAELRVPAPPPTVAPAPPEQRRAPSEDRLLVLTGASGGLGLSRLALLPLLAAPALPAVVGVAAGPLSVGLGLTTAGWLVRARRTAGQRDRLQHWASEALAGARADLDRMVAEALVATEREVTLALDTALDRRDDHDRDTARWAASARAGVAEAEALLARAETVLARRTGSGRVGPARATSSTEPPPGPPAAS